MSGTQEPTDPALEAAQPLWVTFGVMSDPVVRSLVAYPGSGVCYFNGHPHDVADAILNAALRSLGAGTPEAQAALRALVKASLEAQKAFEFYASRPDDSDEGCLRANGTEDARKRAVIAFARLATPTEEGR
jgi:hypothetical protein